MVFTAVYIFYNIIKNNIWVETVEKADEKE